MIFIGTVLFGVQGGRCAGGRDWTLRKRVGGEYLVGGKVAMGERMARIGGSVNGNPVWFPFLAANRGEIDFESKGYWKTMALNWIEGNECLSRRLNIP